MLLLLLGHGGSLRVVRIVLFAEFLSRLSARQVSCRCRASGRLRRRRGGFSDTDSSRFVLRTSVRLMMCVRMRRGDGRVVRTAPFLDLVSQVSARQVHICR